MRNTKVAHRYAKSLLDLAAERGEVEQVERDMVALAHMAKESRELRAVLGSPVIKGDLKEKVLNALFGAGQSKLGGAFMKILADKGRVNYLPDIAVRYVELVKARNGVLSAEVRTAAPLTEEMRNRIVEVISKMRPGVPEIKEIIDPEVIGGFVLKVEDNMIDASVSSQLRKLRREFTDNPYEARI